MVWLILKTHFKGIYATGKNGPHAVIDSRGWGWESHPKEERSTFRDCTDGWVAVKEVTSSDLNMAMYLKTWCHRHGE